MRVCVLRVCVCVHVRACMRRVHNAIALAIAGTLPTPHPHRTLIPAR